MGRVSGKVAFVTGAARGMGRSHCIRLAEEGADVIALDVCAPLPHVAYHSATEDDLAETVAHVESFGRKAVPIQCDVRDREGMARALSEGVNRLGGLDTVVANAGISVVRRWDELTPTIWRDVIDINLTGVWNTVQLAIPYLVGRGSGSIIMISSSTGLKALPFISPYVASKHGVLGLARALAIELSEHNIRVNSLHPCGVRTGMSNGHEFDKLLSDHPHVRDMFRNLLPVSRIDPIDVSNAVIYLASEESRYVTALAMTVDAGSTQY